MLIERKAAQQNEHTSEELKQCLTKHSSGYQIRHKYIKTCMGDWKNIKKIYDSCNFVREDKRKIQRERKVRRKMKGK